jgi:hypothetical protein
MEADDILMRVKSSDEPPHGWIVLPLLRRQVATGIGGWVFGALLGLGLFIGVALAVIPSNYQLGTAAAIFTSLFLAILLFIGLGSTWAIYVDTRRLLNADKHRIIITPDDFVKQEGDKVIHVPLMYVRYVTARGVPPPDRTPGKENAIRQVSGVGENVSSFFFGRNLLRTGNSSGPRFRLRRMRTPTTLAFLDSRTDTEVIVATDKAFGDPFMIAALLKQYAASAQNIA